MERENYLLFKIYLDVTFTAEFCPSFLFSKKHFEFRCWIVMKWIHFLSKTSLDSHLYYIYFSFVGMVVTLSFLEAAEGQI